MTTLLNCYLPIFQLGVAFSLTPDSEATFPLFRQKIVRALEQAGAQSERFCDPDECRSAQFAVVVWLDELVLRAAPPWVAAWRNDLLQARLFNTSTGGEAFFTRLDAIDNTQNRLRQVYLFCLLMGFKGKYAAQDAALLQQLIETERAALDKRFVEQDTFSPTEAKPAGLFSHAGRLVASVIAIYLLLLVSGLYLANGN